MSGVRVPHRPPTNKGVQAGEGGPDAWVTILFKRPPFGWHFFRVAFVTLALAAGMPVLGDLGREGVKGLYRFSLARFSLAFPGLVW
jgi:hypothetical protein